MANEITDEQIIEWAIEEQFLLFCDEEDVIQIVRSAFQKWPTLASHTGEAEPTVFIDFKQATDLIAMFGGEPNEITLQVSDGHSGRGMYASYTDMPEEGAIFLGNSDQEAMPDTPPAATPATSCSSFIDTIQPWTMEHLKTYPKAALEILNKRIEEANAAATPAAPGEVTEQQLIDAAFFAFAEKSVQIVGQIGTWSPTNVLTNEGGELLRRLNEVRALSNPAPVAAPAQPIGYVEALGLRLFAGSASDHTIALRHTPKDGDVPIYGAAPAPAASAEDQWIEQTKHLNCPVCGGSGHVDDVAPAGDAPQRVLLELVMLKEMKDKWEAEELNGFAYKSTDNHRLHNEQRAEYLRRQPIAWEAARHALATPSTPEPAPAASEGVARGIYVASRASVPERPAMWRGLRLKGWPIISTWIDEAGEGETESYAELWQRIHDEIAASDGVLLYAEVDDFPLKGALIECGIALGMGKPVAFVLPDVALAARSMKPIGSWAAHPNVRRFNSLADAKDWLLASPSTPEPAAASGAVAEGGDK